MQGLGERLRVRAEELGLSDSEVARRVGISASRYGKYIRDHTEPDYALLVRICDVLGLTPNDVLLPEAPGKLNGRELLLKRLAASVQGLDEAALGVMTDIVEAGAGAFRRRGSGQFRPPE